ncbi:SDR family NAD(P)-dependent oxidoreductase [Fluviicola sp.]|uniref:SDR family NAD(P)-dependent oxidoreductase n=1 Tax=Fluviicola sp. TaxID=1917219 RepID=UPI003D267C5F
MKTILITGINKGLGKALFDLLIERGYFVYGLLRNEEAYQALSKNKPNNAEFILADVIDDDCMDSIKAVVTNEKIDLLINNAGIGGNAMKLREVTSKEILDLVNVHCLGALRVTKAVISNLEISDKPTVINLSSRLGSITHQDKGTFGFLEVSYSYRISKASQNMLTNCLRLEFPKIKFVSLTPGRLITELAQKDANLTPEESAKRIINFWEEERFENTNGILEIPDNIMQW